MHLRSGVDWNDSVSSNDLLLVKDGNVVDLLSVRAGAPGGDCQLLTILGYYLGTGLDYVSGFHTGEVYRVSVNSRLCG
jgi:hypothetical protein